MSFTPEQIVYIVDDDDAARDSIETLLRLAGFTTRAFASGTEFLSIAPSLRPGCLVSDVRMPELDGLALLERLKSSHLHFPVVFVTGHGDIGTAVRAIKGGAVDFVEKPFDGASMISAVRSAQQDLLAVDEDKLHEIATARLATLTPRERAVFESVVAGKPNKVIARELAISPRTVEFHRSRVMAKMQATSISALVRLGLAAGLDI
jgi:two-component system response regulator FixJ